MDPILPDDVLQRRAQRRAEALARTRRRRTRRAWELAVVVVSALAIALVALASRAGDSATGPPSQAHTTPGAAIVHVRLRPERYGLRPAPPGARVVMGIAHPPTSGLLFNLDTGQMLWSRDPTAVLPIASLTKMMTALIVVDHSDPTEPVLVTRAAMAYQGSGIGLLKHGMRVATETMLYGLMLPSGNDAAIALAQHVSGTVASFVALMNGETQALHLPCTHFEAPDGFIDNGNHSCAADLAVLARAVLSRPRLARIVASPSAIRPFPIKGHKLYLYNNNPLFRIGYRGLLGIKTGWTVAAGHCLVAAARRGHVRLGVVLLHTPGPPGTGPEAAELLNAGFRALGA
ncbi:MAG: D-alanyl-D-alanine carboxypeptidase family protein [Solirubrobacteraceae bacterium]|nr:MAG: hypothetical protein DLM63_11610 [Solirubrobacterales bacterium]